MHYSFLSVLANAFTGQKLWQPAWRDATPKPAYDVVIVGGGGHGLATAYYLAKEHGIRNVAVIEKGWIGSGNAGRNTTIVRSNYMLPGNIPFYEWSMKLWEGLEQELNYNAMVSQRGVLNLYHSDAQRDAYARRGNAMRLHGVDAELIDREQVRAMLPFLEFDNARVPDPGRPAAPARRHRPPRRGRLGLCQGGRPARRRHHPELRSHRLPAGRRPDHRGRDHAAALSAPARSASSVAGISSRVAEWPGCGCRSKPTSCRPSCRKAIKPLIPGVVTFGAGHFYVSQSDKGGLVFGGDIDGYNSYAQRGNLPVVEDVLRGRHGADAGDRAAPHAAPVGAASWTCRWTAARSSTGRRSTGSTSMPAGATAASRRRRPPGGASPIQ